MRFNRASRSIKARTWVVSAAALSLLGIAAITAAAPEASAARTGLAALDMSIDVGSTCTIFCDFCIDESNHKALSTGGIRGGLAHSCDDYGSCAEFHKVCSPALTDGLLNGARYAALGADLDEFVALLRANPDRVHINRDRQAIQVADCDGGLLANFPVSAEIFNALTAEE